MFENKRLFNTSCWFTIYSIVLFLCACSGSNVTTTGTPEYDHILEIKNHDRLITFTEVPSRAVTLNQHTTEIMLALNLEKHMVGTAYLDDHISSEWQQQYEKIPVLSDQYPSQEVFLNVEPDFAYAGWESAFREDNIGTTDQLEEFGIKAYLHESSTVIGPTMEDIYRDIRNISTIFDVEKRGEALIASIDEEIKLLQEKVKTTETPLRTFVYDSGEAAPVTAARNFLNELITMAGGKNIFSNVEKSWSEVSWEEVVDRNPEVIVIVDYGQITSQQKKSFLLSHPALTNVDAVRNEHFVIMPLSAAAEGVKAPEALRILVNGFYD